jgi:hypothetical protein
MNCLFLKEKLENMKKGLCEEFLVVNSILLAVQILLGIFLYVKMVNDFRRAAYLQKKQKFDSTIQRLPSDE